MLRRRRNLHNWIPTFPRSSDQATPRRLSLRTSFREVQEITGQVARIESIVNSDLQAALAKVDQFCLDPFLVASGWQEPGKSSPARW